MTIASKENPLVWRCLSANPAIPKRNGHRRVSVLLVDDDDEFREAAAVELDYLGFDVATVADGDAMFKRIAVDGETDVIILDWKLPNRLGIDYLRSMRERNITTPVIIFTGVPATAYESAALDCGAHDFVDKARGLTILAKRIRRIAEASTAAPTPVEEEVKSGNLALRPKTGRAYWNGMDLNLTVTEFNIIRLMVTHANEHVTYRSIYDWVHHPGFVAGNGADGYRTNVRSMVKRIRNKFRAYDPDFSQIENFSAFGYRWRAEPCDPE